MGVVGRSAVSARAIRLSRPREPPHVHPTAEVPIGSLAYVYLLAFVAALGGLLFGYDTAVISGAIGFMEEHFHLDEIQKGWVASSALIGCILGAAGAGVLSDALGRKKVLLLSAVLFTVSALGAALPTA